MIITYHRIITEKALNSFLSVSVLEIVIQANIYQDNWLHGQIGHPEYHFDQNAFRKGWAYIEHNRGLVRPALELEDSFKAQLAFGRLTHAVQDFFAHSNYVYLWLSQFPKNNYPPPEEIDPFDISLIHSPILRSGKIYWPFEPVSWIPVLKNRIVPFLPRDSHAWMNLDDPGRGPLFQYAVEAAVKSTRYELELTVQGLSQDLAALFCGKNDPFHEV